MILPFSEKAQISLAEAEAALDSAVSQVEKNLPVYAGKCQNHSSVDGIYPACANDQWTCGFWPGEIWLAWERTQKPCFKIAAEQLVESFYRRITNKVAVDHHDMGFLYSPSCVSAWKLTGNQLAKEAALLAADQLAARFQEKGGFIQAWGAMGEPENYRYIIDCLLNVPLLRWAYTQNGNERLKHVADTHIKTCLANSFRKDFSTYHTFFMNPEDGSPSHGATCQGYKDDSSWARGQAWAVYGIALAYKYVPDASYISLFDSVAAYFLKRLPQDLVPYWDLIFQDGSDEPRDSSSGAIAACGLLQMADLIQDQLPGAAENYRIVARQLLKSLADGYAVKPGDKANGLLLHGTYSKKSPYNTCTPEGVDECVSWGDYFYMEALTRLTKNWDTYW